MDGGYWRENGDGATGRSSGGGATRVYVQVRYPEALVCPRACRQVRDNDKKKVYIVAEARLPALPGAVPKPKKGAKKVGWEG